MLVRCLSHYSFGDGFLPPEALVDHAAECGLSLLLSDRETLAGQPALHARARERGVRVLSGLELGTGRGGGRLVLVARDAEGYASLCALVSLRKGARPAGCTDGSDGAVPGMPMDALGAPGLELLTDDPALARRLLERVAGARERLGLLLRRPSADPRRGERLARLARDEGLPLVADVVVTLGSRGERARAGLARGVLAAGAADLPNLRVMPSTGALALGFADVPDALGHARALVERSAFRLEPGPPVLPAPHLPEGTSAAAWLDARAREGLGRARAAGRCLGEAYGRRLERELETIRAAGLAAYFHLVLEIARVARERDVPLALRGSAGASLVLHVLGISAVDPVAADLLFERFLNPERADLPDVDLDVCAERRPLLLATLFEELGPERVAQLASYQTLGRTAAFARGLAALGAGEADIAALRRRLPPPDLREECGRPAWRRVVARALRGTRFADSSPAIAELVGLPTHLSVHPGAVVVGDGPLARRAPLERAPKGIPVLQYHLEAAAWLGFVKIDVLGNRALTQIRRAREQAGAARDDGALERALADPRDPATLAVLRGDTIGCFQLETPLMRRVLAERPPGHANDLVEAVALVRPGPGGPRASRPGGAPRRRLLYEDDVVREIAWHTGLPLGGADALRADLVAAGDDSAAVDRVRRRFESAARREGRAPADTERRWRSIRRFAAYAFNRAHAASYAAVAWECAVLRAHRPAAFACAVLDHYGGGYPLRSVAAAFARTGLRVLAPHVSRSGWDTRVERGTVRLGLRHVRGLGARTAARILASQGAGEKLGFARFLERVRPERAELEALLLCGALDGLPPLEAGAYPVPHLRALREAEPQRTLELGPSSKPDPVPATERDRLLLRVRNELRILSMHPTEHPVALLRPDAERVGARPVRWAGAPAEARAVTRFVGILAASRRVRSARGVTHFLTLEDETGLLEVVVPPAVEARVRTRISTPGPYLIEGVLRGGPLSCLLAHDLRRFARADAEGAGAGIADGASAPAPRSAR